MKIILIAGIKGGSGKSTITVNLATALAANSRVLVVDADKQASSFEWCLEREKTAENKISAIQCFGVIDAVITKHAKNYDYIIIDCSGRDSTELRTALTIADNVLIPLKPSTFDFSTFPAMAELIKNAKQINQKLTAHVVLSIVPTNAGHKEITGSREAIKNYSDDIEVARTIIFDRKWYKDSSSDGVGVVEMTVNNPSLYNAKQEISQLIDEVIYGNSKD